MIQNLPYLQSYRELLIEEDAIANPPTSTADNAPVGAMSSGPYMDEFNQNPKIAAYNTVTKKRKYFTRREDLDTFLKDNSNWIINEKLEGFYQIETDEPIILDDGTYNFKQWGYTIQINGANFKTKSGIRCMEISAKHGECVIKQGKCYEQI